MPLSRVASLSALILVASVWAACLSVPGIWLIVDGPVVWPRFSTPCIMGGAAAVAAGTFVFVVIVVGRLLPNLAARPHFWLLEMLTFLTFVLAGAVGILLALRTSSGGVA